MSAEYTDSRVCAQCHSAIWETYRRTGMGRSFYAPSAATRLEDYSKTYYHRASETYYEMVQRDGKFFQRQYQLDFDGKPTNVSETAIDFIVGSGNHSRAYLHRTPKNTLIELPLAWYSEKGGYWAMNPGYDRPDHQGTRRLIGYDCMFCHNGYPEIPSEEKRGADPVFLNIPQGIDCQRCHGPGAEHTRLARDPKSSRAAVRAAIVNPARLTPERQAEVCLQCHLETSSLLLPNSMVRFERAPFSYQPGEPLSDYMLHFDQAPGRDQEQRFEIAGAAYRLRRSACFRKSNGAMQCTTCHDPHNIPRGEEAARHYTAVCRQCHSAAFDRLVASGKHTAAADCIGCHMPKRRTSDAVHVVMTDHFIQRRKPAADLEAEIAERPGDENPYRGEVVLYYPENLPQPQDELYLAAAQVRQQSNLREGIAHLEAAIEKYHPERPDYELQLADALRESGQPARALPVYEQVLRRRPNLVGAMQSVAVCLMSLKEYPRAIEALKQSFKSAPANATTWQLLGSAYFEQGDAKDALAAFQKAIELDDSNPEAYNSLGGVLLESGDRARAEPTLRKAIALDPNHAQAHNNLANLLALAGRLDEARYHFRAALRVAPSNSSTRYDYAVALARAGLRDEAAQQLETALKTEPNNAGTHEFLGTLLASKGDVAHAIEQYREALRLSPDFARANLRLGESLIDSGDEPGALPYLRKAAASSDVAIREEALRFLKKAGQ